MHDTINISMFYLLRCMKQIKKLIFQDVVGILLHDPTLN